MRKLLVIMAILIALFIFYKPVQALETAGSSAVLKNDVLGIKKPDPRIQKLEAFFVKYNSPLAPYAEQFVKVADHYQLDWRLVPAIAGVESTFGKQIPVNSYNAYGWNNGNYCFESWEDSIEHVSEVLKEKYIDRGLISPYKIGPFYAPPSQTWASKIVFFMEQIECFGQENCLNNLNLTI